MDDSVRSKVDNFFLKYRTRTFESGQMLIHAGDEPPGVMHLIQGQVRQYDISDGGDEVVLNVYAPPAFFPMSWAINRTPNKYFYQTFNPVILKQAPVEDVVEFLKNNNDVMFNLLSRLYNGTEGLLGRMSQLMRGSGRSRVIYEIILECKRFGIKQPGGTYHLLLHEDELARRAGLSRETVSRECGILKAKQLISIDHQGITVFDITNLEAQLD
jgi:CRP-like cAMP-binding protein